MKVGGLNRDWIKEVGSYWVCQHCSHKFEKDTIAIELHLQTSNETGYRKIYACPNCALKIYEEGVDKIKIAKARGADGFLMFRDM